MAIISTRLVKKIKRIAQETPQEGSSVLPGTMTGIPADVLRYFGIEDYKKMSINEENQLAFICQEFKKQELSSAEIMLNIREMEKKTKNASQGQSRIGNIYNYFRLANTSDRLGKLKKKAYE